MIVHRVVHDPEFDDVVRSDELARGATAIGLLQAILEVDPAPRLRLGEVDDDVDALCHCDADTVLDERAGQQVAVGAEPVERLPVAQGELQKARGPADQEPEAILPALDVQIRLDLRIHRHLVAQDPVQVEQVEEELAGGRIEHLVHEEHGDVELAAGQAEPGRLVVGVEQDVVAEERAEGGEHLVRVLRGEVDLVVVIPEEAHRLPHVARDRPAVQSARGNVRGEARAHVRVVIVVEEALVVAPERASIRLGRVVTVVQVRGGLVPPESAVVVGQRVVYPVEDRLPILGLDAERPDGSGRPLHERPDRRWRYAIAGRIEVEADRLLDALQHGAVEARGRVARSAELGPPLVRLSSRFPEASDVRDPVHRTRPRGGIRVPRLRRRRIQRDGPHRRWNRERVHERRVGRADERNGVVGVGPVGFEAPHPGQLDEPGAAHDQSHLQ